MFLLIISIASRHVYKFQFALKHMVDRKVVNKVIVGLLILAVFIAAIFVLKPLILAIFLGIFVAYIVHPLYYPIKRILKGENLSTLVFCFLILVIVAIPMIWLLPSFVKEIFNTYLYVQKMDISGTLGTLLGGLFGAEVATLAAVQVNLFIANFFKFTINSFGEAFSNLPNLLMQFGIFILTFYFATKDSEKVRAYLSELSPLSKSTEEKFAKEFRNITNSIMLGQVLVGIIQGLCLGLGLWILGVPKVLFLTIITMVASIIPVLGSWLVWIPVSLYLMVSGQVVSGIILFFYGMLFVGTIDNVLRSYFVSRHSSLNIFVAVIGVVGGLLAFGFIGLILGPLILAYVLIIVEFYRKGKLNELFGE